MSHSKLLVGTTADIWISIYIQNSVLTNLNHSSHVPLSQGMVLPSNWSSKSQTGNLLKLLSITSSTPAVSSGSWTLRLASILLGTLVTQPSLQAPRTWLHVLPSQQLAGVLLQITKLSWISMMPLIQSQVLSLPRKSCFCVLLMRSNLLGHWLLSRASLLLQTLSDGLLTTPFEGQLCTRVNSKPLSLPYGFLRSLSTCLTPASFSVRPVCVSQGRTDYL